MSRSGLVVAAPRSGSGKTTLTLGLMRALTRRGIAVAGAKCGPDYIDPAFHAAACGRASVNLDSWAMSKPLLRALAAEAERDADIVICEGLMGLFDGVPGETGATGSTADIAALCGWPVLLVLDVSGQSTTAAAIVKGFMSYDLRVKLGGVILNRVGSERHRRLVSEAIEQLGVPVLGSLPRSDKVRLPERHLGLVQAGETSGLDGVLEAMADFVAAHVDVEAVMRMAGQSLESEAQREAEITAVTPVPMALSPPGRRIALARDQAFSFIYPHVLQGWRAAGVEIVPFRRSRTSRRLPLAIAAGCPAAIPSCTRRGSPRRASFSRACAVSRGRGRCMANAAATWCSVAPSSMLQARATPWPGFCPLSRASRGRRCSSAIATRAFSPTPRSAARARD